MKIKVIGSTKVGYELPLKEALDFGGKSAGICYLPSTFDEILEEPTSKTQKRVIQTLTNKHHSVYDHAVYNLLLEDVPKVIAMILNNEKQYTTSEKSARYTQMILADREQVLYDKWLEIFKKKILETYPGMREIDATKLAQENARGLTSVFTPTVFEYTVSIRQLNNIIHWFNEFIESPYQNEFFNQIKVYMKQFNDCIQKLCMDDLYDLNKMRSLSLFDKMQHHDEVFEEVYVTTYEATFAQLAQAQRHRTLSYSMKLLDETKYFTPIIIKEDNDLSMQWQEDIKLLADIYPQSMLISVCEKGTCENFALKCLERLCSHAQLEISLQTYSTLKKYLSATESKNKEVYNYLKKFDSPARCGIQGYKCTSPCKYGIKQLERLV